MGAVYMAEQEEPVRRRVALKIIKLGMDTKQVVARFEAERQALALMDHPNIARVLDGGATDTGRPYFVMELVQGVPITKFCDKNKLPARERLKLYIQVCQAIQSAHQKGIIHRDIKPSNVLVTLHHGEPIPKVIDLGIAKATNQKLTEKTLFTQHATMIGTPTHMSPEQAEMSSLDVDTRTDVYALGVLLYELLTGTTPFPEKRMRSLGYGEMQRVIMEEEPQPPSTRLSTMANEQKTAVARNQGGEFTALSKLLKGDLDWIVMKCLEKDAHGAMTRPTVWRWTSSVIWGQRTGRRASAQHHLQTREGVATEQTGLHSWLRGIPGAFGWFDTGGPGLASSPEATGRSSFCADR
jgi:eukaryotic-like serine/threonine-protein kinase